MSVIRDGAGETVKNTTPTSESTAPKERQPGIPFVEAVGIRDYFAAAALQGMLANQLSVKGFTLVGDYDLTSAAAISAYEYADAMLAARTQEPQP